ASDQNIRKRYCEFADAAQNTVWQRHYVSYRPKVKKDGYHHKARENVEYISRDGFQHDPPPWWVRRSIELGLYFDKEPDDPQPTATRPGGLRGISPSCRTCCDDTVANAPPPGTTQEHSQRCHPWPCKQL